MEEQLKFWNRPEDSVIQENLEKAGITQNTTVILYATTPATTAAHRAGVLMKYAGVKDIRFLNGGKHFGNFKTGLWRQNPIYRKMFPLERRFRLILTLFMTMMRNWDV